MAVYAMTAMKMLTYDRRVVILLQWSIMGIEVMQM